MGKITWDDTATRRYEAGVDHGVLYPRDNVGAYPLGVAWNGLTKVTESPDGAEPQIQYADNIQYIRIMSTENFKGTIEALTYPKAWESCDGSATVATGVKIGQQSRQVFGLVYRTKIGDDVQGLDKGYKLNLIWGGLAAPSSRDHETINDSPAAMAFSWEISTTPVSVTGYKDTATMVLDSTEIPSASMTAIETILFGSEGVDPRLPMPDEIIALITAPTSVIPTEPTYTPATHTIAIPTVAGVTYKIGGVAKTGNVVLTAGQKVVVVATPNQGYYIPDGNDDDWAFEY